MGMSLSLALSLGSAALGGGGGSASSLRYAASGGKSLLAGGTSGLTSIKYLNARTPWVACVDIYDPRAILPNWGLNGSYSEVAPGGAATFTHAFEYNGVSYPCVGGVAAAGGQLVTGPATGCFIPEGATFYTRTFGAMFAAWYNDGIRPTGACFEYSGSVLTDRTTATGTFTSTDASTTWGPLGVLAVHNQPAGYLLGDSIDFGNGGAGRIDVPTAAFNLGMLARVVGPNFGYVDVTRPGMAMTTFNPATNTNRLALAAYATFLVQGLDTNDVNVGGAVATLETNSLATRNLYPGLKAFSVTTPPITTGVFTTTAGQIVTANEANRTTWNDNKRAGASGFDGNLELANLIEVNAAGVPTQNGGRWPANATSDGLHPVTATYPTFDAYATAAAAIITAAH